MAERSVKKNSQIPSAYGGVEAVGAQRGAGYTTPLHGAVAGICLSELLSCATPPRAWGSRDAYRKADVQKQQLPRVRGAVAVSDRHAGSATRNSPVCVGQTAGDRRCACVQHATPPRARSRRDAHCTDYIGKKQLPSVRGADEGMKRMLSVFISNSPACVGQTALQTHSERISKAQIPRARGAVPSFHMVPAQHFSNPLRAWGSRQPRPAGCARRLKSPARVGQSAKDRHKREAVEIKSPARVGQSIRSTALAFQLVLKSPARVGQSRPSTWCRRSTSQIPCARGAVG